MRWFHNLTKSIHELFQKPKSVAENVSKMKDIQIEQNPVKNPCPICEHEMLFDVNTFRYSLKCITGCKSYLCVNNFGGDLWSIKIITIGTHKYKQFETTKWGERYTIEEYESTLNMVRDLYMGGNYNEK